MVASAHEGKTGARPVASGAGATADDDAAVAGGADTAASDNAADDNAAEAANVAPRGGSLPAGRGSRTFGRGPRVHMLAAPVALIVLVALWQAVCSFGLVPTFMLPSPVAVVRALVGDWPLLMTHAATSLAEAGAGLAAGVALGAAAALAMDRFTLLYRALYPLVVLTQTIPSVAIAPLLVLWFGYGMLPKVVLIVVATFFPITVGLLEGLRSVDADQIDLMRSMGATRWQIMRHVKLPAALPHLFSGLKISAAYAIVGAVIAEWLGGFSGLGVYMTRVRKAYSFDKMFAVIFLISGLSLVLMWAVEALRRLFMPWDRIARDRDDR